MRIAFVVHGRFHAFDLARALIARRHDVEIFTNYPVWAAKNFGLPAANVHSFWPHGVASRVVNRLGAGTGEFATAAFHKAFGRWAAYSLRKEKWDVIHTFSGVAEECFLTREDARHFLVRGSAHIRTQRQILDEESSRIGVKLERPGDWMIDREEREYELCDRLLVLSDFARQSFIARGFPASKLALLPLGVDTQAFRLSAEALESRRRRILSGEPLRVMFTGTLNYRKGLYDIERIIRGVDSRRFRFQIIGSVSPEGKAAVARLPSSVEFVPRRPQAELPRWYAGGDLYLFPTLEDGFAVVLAQAFAGGMPILTTAHCAGPDIIRHGETGWILPIRNPDAFIEQLRWCDEHRDLVVEMVDRIHGEFRSRSWDTVAADFETIASRQ